MRPELLWRQDVYISCSTLSSTASRILHTPKLSLRPLCTALQVLETVITMGDLQSFFRDVRPVGKVTGLVGFISPCYLMYCMHVRYIVYGVCKAQNGLTMVFVFIASRFVIYLVSLSLYTIMFDPLTQPPNLVPRWLMVQLLMFPLAEGITHRGIILSVLISIISLSFSLSVFILPLPKSPDSPLPALTPTQTPIRTSLVPVLHAP